MLSTAVDASKTADMLATMHPAEQLIQQVNMMANQVEQLLEGHHTIQEAFAQSGVTIPTLPALTVDVPIMPSTRNDTSALLFGNVHSHSDGLNVLHSNVDGARPDFAHPVGTGLHGVVSHHAPAKATVGHGQ